MTSTVTKQYRREFLRVLASEIEAFHMSLDQSILILGGGLEDEQALRQAGFKNILNSNLPTDLDRLDGDRLNRDQPGKKQHLALDAENLELPDNSYDLVFASEVLHHCSSPHKALCEMLRVCRKYVLFLEPNDSLTMAALVKLNMSFPYEIPAVVDHNYKTGGVRDSHIPNFIFRWNRNEVFKTVASYIPERLFSVHAHPYWELNVTEKALDLRKQTRIGSITSIVGAGNFLAMLRFGQFVMNSVPGLRGQGNKFFCCIEKSSDLQPWMARENGEIVFNRSFGNGNGKK